MYGNNGDTFGFNYNGNDYFYIKNAQNDVTAIADSTGEIVVNYNYDAWGEINSITGSLASTIGELNPIRYRSYYFDSEINMYYLNSRYYSPDLCRFLNADGIVQSGQGLLDKNMFSYCGNDPINRFDPSGNSWLSNKWNSFKSWLGSIFGAGSSTTATIVKDEIAIIPDPWPITVKSETKTTETISKHGNSKKPISVYSDYNANHPIKSSSAGLKFNIKDFSVKINLAIDNISISSSIENGNTTNSLGLKVNLSELKLGVESSTSIKWDETTDTENVNISANAWAIAAVYVFLKTGQTAPSPEVVYG